MLNVTAFDQAGNQQAALWNVNEVDESATEKEVKSADNYSINTIASFVLLTA